MLRTFLNRNGNLFQTLKSGRCENVFALRSTCVLTGSNDEDVSISRCGIVFFTTPNVKRSFHSSAKAFNDKADGDVKNFSIDPREVAKFSAVANSWWHPFGPFAPLHAMNPARVNFIRETAEYLKSLRLSIKSKSEGDSKTVPESDDNEDPGEPLRGLTVVDVGCGGGILSESLARLGAQVTSIDVSKENVSVASIHAAKDPLVNSRITYRCMSAEELCASGARFDIVISSEVIEHVLKPEEFISTLSSMRACPETSPLVISTINRTIPAWAVVIAGAEYVVGTVPRGTHEWDKFLTPEELAIMGRACGLDMTLVAGMVLGLDGRFTLKDDLTINYIASFFPVTPSKDDNIKENDTKDDISKEGSGEMEKGSAAGVTVSSTTTTPSRGVAQ